MFSSQSLHSLRLQAYRHLLLEDISDDYAIQDYQSQWDEAQKEVKKLFTYLDSQRDTLAPETQAELLLTIFVLLQIGYRNPVLFNRVTEATYTLINSQLSILNYQFSIFSSLLTFLYQETQDDSLLPTLDRLMSARQEIDMTEEDHYLQKLFPINEYA